MVSIEQARPVEVMRKPKGVYIYNVSVSSRIFCLGEKNSLESFTTPTFVGTLYWHVINLFCTTLGISYWQLRIMCTHCVVIGRRKKLEN